jgi:hypothetical protein
LIGIRFRGGINLSTNVDSSIILDGGSEPGQQEWSFVIDQWSLSKGPTSEETSTMFGMGPFELLILGILGFLLFVVPVVGVVVLIVVIVKRGSDKK